MEQLHLPEKASIKNSQETSQEQVLDDFSQLINLFQNWETSPEKKEYIFQHILKIAQIQHQYDTQKAWLQNEVREFIFSSLNNNLWTSLWENNIKKFDVDKNNHIDATEANNFASKLWKKIWQIIVLGWINEFKKIHDESSSKNGFSNLDKYLADKVNLAQYFWDKSLSESFIQSQGNISEHDLHQMKQRKMNVFDGNSRKELWILLANELWTGIEEILKFLWNIPSWLILLKRYWWYRMDTFSNDPLLKTQAEIKREELVNQNPSLMLLELFWEKWLQMLQQLGDMLKSGKQWDIATLLVSIFWLLAWWAWAARLGLNLWRKMAVSQARNGLSTVPKMMRNSMKAVSRSAWKVSHTMWKIDDLVAWAWIWHLAWAYSWWGNAILHNQETAPKFSQSSSWPNYSQEVILNSDWYRRWENGLPNKILREAGLPNLDAHQLQVVTDVHLYTSKWIYQNTPEDLLKMTRVLRQADISPAQVRILMEKWITGEFKISTKFLSEIKSIEAKIWLSDLPDYLDNFAGQELRLEQLIAVINENPKEFLQYKALQEYLDLFDIKAPKQELFDMALHARGELRIQELMQNPTKITSQDIKNIIQSWKNIDNFLSEFVQKWDKKQISLFFENMFQSYSGFPTSMFSQELVSKILSSNMIEKNHLAKYIISAVDGKVSQESLKIIEAFLKTENGKWLFTSDYRTKIEAQIVNKLSNSWDIFEQLAWKNISAEDIYTMMKQKGTSFVHYEKFCEVLDAHDIPLPSKELFDAGRKMFDEGVFKTKLEKPYTITPDDIVYFSKEWKDINQLFISFVSYGNETQISDFFKKLDQSKISFDTALLSNSSLKSIFVSQKIDIADMARFISHIVQWELSVSKTWAIKKFLESQLAEKLFTSDYRGQMIRILDNKFVW